MPSSACPAPPPALPSFPTRRSSDLEQRLPRRLRPAIGILAVGVAVVRIAHARLRARAGAFDEPQLDQLAVGARLRRECERGVVAVARSEEHTSELQSRGHLVCRLLLVPPPPPPSPLSLPAALPISSSDCPADCGRQLASWPLV